MNEVWSFQLLHLHPDHLTTFRLYFVEPLPRLIEFFCVYYWIIEHLQLIVLRHSEPGRFRELECLAGHLEVVIAISNFSRVQLLFYHPTRYRVFLFANSTFGLEDGGCLSGTRFVDLWRVGQDQDMF